MIDMEHKYKVLVAEDEPLILAGLKFYVEEWGYASAMERSHWKNVIHLHRILLYQTSECLVWMGLRCFRK